MVRGDYRSRRRDGMVDRLISNRNIVIQSFYEESISFWLQSLSHVSENAS